LPDYWWHIAAFVSSLVGGGNVSSFILNLIITDSTEESERTSKFLRINAMCTAAGAMGSLLVGFWIEYRGFPDLYWTALLVQLLTIVLVYHYMKPQSLIPVLPTIAYENSNSKVLNNIYAQLVQICTVFSPRHTRRSRKRSISLFLTLIAFTFHCLASLAFGVPFLWFQLNHPFCWSGNDP
jgi:predicted MFS family arabinose efflux permease